MKRQLQLLAVLMLALCSLGARAATTYDFEVDGQYFKILSADDKTVAFSRNTSAAYSGDIVIPASVTYDGVTYTVTEIYDQCWYGNSNVTSVTMPNTIVKMGYRVGHAANGMTSITLSPNITEIGEWAFRSNTKLTELTLPEELRAISTYMVGYCSNITEMVIPDKVEYIGTQAFAGCSKMHKVTIGAAVDSIYEKAFYNLSKMDTLIVRATTPPGVGTDALTKISRTDCILYVPEASMALYSSTAPWSEFENLRAYDSSASGDEEYFTVAGVTYHVTDKANSVVEVYKSAEEPYAGTVVIRNSVNYADKDYSVTAVADSAFYGCSTLASLTLPSAIANIGNYAFNGCSALTNFVVLAVTPPALGTDALTGIDKTACTLYVPESSVSAYKGADIWKEFNNYFIYVSEFVADGIKYYVNDIVAHTVTVEANNYEGAVIIPDEVDYQGFKFTCTEIGSKAFYARYNMTELRLPSTLKVIGSQAFASMQGIDEINVPEGVTTLGSEAFDGCKMKRITLPKESLTSFGSNMFYACYNLEGVALPGSIKAIPASTFYGANIQWIEIGEGIESIGTYAFMGCDMGSVTLPNSCTTLSENAFYACNGLSSFYTGTGLKSVGSSAFYGCSNLTKVFIQTAEEPEGFPDNLYLSSGMSRTSYVPNSSYTGANYGNIRVNANVTDIKAVDGVRYIVSAADASKVEAVDATYAEADTVAVVTDAVTIDGKSYTVSRIASDLSATNFFLRRLDYRATAFPAVADGMAYSCKNLSEVNLCEGVTSIGADAFAYSGVQQITFPSTLKTIGSQAFFRGSLTSVTIPASVTSLANGALTHNASLTDVVFEDGSDNLSIGVYVTMFGTWPMFNGCPVERATIGRNLSYTKTAAQGYSPFYNDSTLVEVVLTDVPTEVYNYMFLDCKSLERVTLGKNIAKIGTKAFGGCVAVDSIYSAATTPATVTSGAFASIDKTACTLYVPRAAVKKYAAAAEWKDFFIQGVGDYIAVYLRGDFNSWGATDAYKFSTDDGVEYVIKGVTIPQGDEFKIGDADWSEVDYGGATDIVIGSIPLRFQGGNCTTAGTFVGDITFNLDTFLATFTGEMSGVEGISVDSEGAVEYYNLQGVRVERPTTGVYIRRTATSASKVYIK